MSKPIVIDARFLAGGVADHHRPDFRSEESIVVDPDEVAGDRVTFEVEKVAFDQR
jgi:hypothetical protein